MHQVRLKFLSVNELWQFKQLTKVADVEVIIAEKVLIGSFSPAEVKMACEVYQAIVIESFHSIS